jgi:hypothetical protein
VTALVTVVETTVTSMAGTVFVFVHRISTTSTAAGRPASEGLP